MVISSVGVSPPSAQQPPTQETEVTGAAVAAKNRTISAAVKLLNEAGVAGASHELSIAIDPTTRQAVVRVVDLSTKEVIEQFPSEYLLQVAQQLSERLAK